MPQGAASQARGEAESVPNARLGRFCGLSVDDARPRAPVAAGSIAGHS